MANKMLYGVEIIDIDDVIETVEYCPEIVKKKPYQAKLTRRKGLAKYIEKDGSTKIAVEATFYDCGPEGVSRGYTQPDDPSVTEEERAANRRHLQELAVQAMVDQGIW